MRGYLVYVLIVKIKILISLIMFKFSNSVLDWTALMQNFFGFFKNIFRGVCGPYHLYGLHSESALIIDCSLACALCYSV